MSDKKNIIPQMEKKDDKDTVEVPQSLIEQMQQEIKDLKIKQKKIDVKMGDDVIDDEEDKQRTARMRMYNDKLVIGYNKKKGTWKEFDTLRREDRLMQEIILLEEDGEETTLKVDYLRFQEDAPTVELPVTKTEKKEVVEKKGLIRVRKVVDYKTVVKKDKVMQKVVSSDNKFTIKLKNGKELTLDIDFINL